MQKEIDFIVYMFDGLFPNSFFPSEIAEEKKSLSLIHVVKL